MFSKYYAISQRLLPNFFFLINIATHTHTHIYTYTQQLQTLFHTASHACAMTEWDLTRTNNTAAHYLLGIHTLFANVYS